jgi:hypothetical protein
MKKQPIIFVIFLAVVLILSIGYATFSESITVSGTATASATMDVEFTTASVTSEVGSINASATISNDKNTLSINVPRLEYPGAYAVISGTITNVGTIPVELTNISETNLITDDNIKISYTNLGGYEYVTMNPNGTRNFTVKVEWDEDSEASTNNLNFSIVLNYVQA